MIETPACPGPMPQVVVGSQALSGAPFPTKTGIVVRLVGGKVTVFVKGAVLSVK
jgi:hypothetical protein